MTAFSPAVRLVPQRIVIRVRHEVRGLLNCTGAGQESITAGPDAQLVVPLPGKAQRRGNISRPARFPPRLSTTRREQVAATCGKAFLKRAETLSQRLLGRDDFRRLRRLLRASAGHLPRARKAVQDPCYKQECRTISSLP